MVESASLSKDACGCQSINANSFVGLWTLMLDVVGRPTKLDTLACW